MKPPFPVMIVKDQARPSSVGSGVRSNKVKTDYEI